jgi:hypothetical protein
MNNNKLIGGGFMALLSPRALALKVPSFAIERVRVDNIRKERMREVKG